jgi:hypothetical protein
MATEYQHCFTTYPGNLKRPATLTGVVSLLSLNNEIPELSVLLASDDNNSVLLHVERGRGVLDGSGDEGGELLVAQGRLVGESIVCPSVLYSSALEPQPG